MRKSLLGLVAVLALAAAAPEVQAASCACEHMGSTRDGLCEAFPQTGTETYTWHPWGCAYLPYPSDPSSLFAYYDCAASGAGGLRVTVKLASGSSSTVACSFHTGGCARDRSVRPARRRTDPRACGRASNRVGREIRPGPRPRMPGWPPLASIVTGPRQRACGRPRLAAVITKRR